MSAARNLVPDDTNGVYDIFVRDRAPSVADLLTALRNRIRGFGLPKGIETSLLTKARADCGPLAALANHARAQAGKHLTQSQAAELMADVHQIRAALGCARKTSASDWRTGGWPSLRGVSSIAPPPPQPPRRWPWPGPRRH
jgi:hypothetical protein